MSYLSNQQLHALLDQIQVFVGKPRRVEELSGGLTNRNVKVTLADATYVVRCSDTRANFLGIDRDREFHNSVAAAQAGVGAPVIDYRPDLGVLVIGYLNGSTLTNADFGRQGVIAKVAAGCRALHSGPRFQGRFNMFELQANYLKTVQNNGFRIPPGYLSYAEAFARIEKVLAMTDRGTVPCNNDLLAGNFVEDGEKIWLIDYEYAGNNDPCFELGNIWSECSLSLDQLDELVTAYYGVQLRHKIAQARLHGIAAKYGWTLWGCIQNAASPIGYDFWQWGMERFEAAIGEFEDSGFSGLLDDALARD